MFNQDFIQKLLYLDVETVSLYKNLLDLEAKNPRAHSLWKKRESYYRSAFEELRDESSEKIYSDKAGLEPEFSRIVCVSFGTFDSSSTSGKKFISFYGDDEKDILIKSAKVLSNAVSKNWKLCGHNIKGFDIPCLGKRMIYNGVELPPNLKIWDKKPWEMPFVDTSEVFSFGSWVHQKYLSLDLLSCSLGIPSPKESMDGSMVNHYYWDLMDSDSIKKYCESDVNTVMEVMSLLAI
jgi:predicted PolB exonuclease-like 3'-5' exonuclease